MIKNQKIPALKNLVWPFVVLLIAFGAFYIKPWQQKPQETISVSATGTAKSIPNIAKINATLEVKNPQIDLARKEAESKTSAVIEKLVSLGIEQKDIKTTNLSGGNSYEILPYPAPDRSKTSQFQTTLEITIRNFDKTDKVISTLTENGITNLYGPNLTIDDQTLEEAKSQARAKAVENAKQKAGQLAQTSDRKIGKVAKIVEQGDYNYPQPIYALGGADLREKASQIQTGQDEISITLQVDFTLK